MSGTLLCVTAVMSNREARTCAVWGEHLPVCLDDSCRGCLPRPAQVGMLCESCAAKYEQALRDVTGIVTHLRSVERGPQSLDGVRVAPGSKVPIPASWIAADEIWIALVRVVVAYDPKNINDKWPVWGPGTTPSRGFESTATLEQVASAVQSLAYHVQGLGPAVISREAAAVEAVRFLRQVQQALHRYPTEDHASDVYRRPCHRCGLMTLEHRPPLDYLDEAVDVCRACGYHADPLMVDFDRRVYAERAWSELDPVQQEAMLAGMDEAERRIVRNFRRPLVETERARIWEAVGVEFGRTGRVIWWNTPRPGWGGLTADQMLEAGRGSEVMDAIGTVESA